MQAAAIADLARSINASMRFALGNTEKVEMALRDPRMETPAYLYDLAAVRLAHHQLTHSLPDPTSLLYSVKANPHPAVLRQLAALGCQAEICSPGELSAAVQAGFLPAGMFYTGPGKRDADLAQALLAGVRRFSVDSPGALDQLDRISSAAGETVEALIRINPPVPLAGAGLPVTGGPAQFGVDLDWLLEQPSLFNDRPRVRVAGLHLYMGSNLAQESALIAMFGYGLKVARQAEQALGRELPILDLGGGFGAPYAVEGDLPRFSSLRDRLGALLRTELPGWPEDGRRIVFESGRYLTAGCGTFLASVLDVKQSQGRRIVVLDAGVNFLGGMSGLGREAKIDPQLRVLGRPRGTLADQSGERTIVSGPLCHPLDVWTRDGHLSDVAVGDTVAVSNVGAYGLHSGLALFHCHPLPIEVVMDSGREVERSRNFIQRKQVDE